MDDAIAYGVCEAFEAYCGGAAKREYVRAGYLAAQRFLAKECSLSLKFVREAKNDAGEFAFMLDNQTAIRPRQEADADAHKIEAIIGDREIVEQIAYGTSGEGGMKRIKAQLRVAKLLSLRRDN